MIKHKKDNDVIAVSSSTPLDAPGPSETPLETPLETLRNATGEYHRQLEETIDWMGAFQSYESYRRLLERFAVVVRPLERAIAQQLAKSPPPQFDPSLRTRWLESDLATMTAILGSPAEHEATSHVLSDASPQLRDSTSNCGWSAQDFAYIDNSPAAIGALYVVEGSSLGGQFLSRQLHARLQLTPEVGGAYFAGYGAATGQHWQAFRHWANLQLGDSQSVWLAAEAAKLTFARFGKALAGLAYE